MAPDRRNSYRLNVTDGHAQVHAPCVSLSVQDLNVSGGGLILNAGDPALLSQAPVKFQLGAYPPFQASIRPVRAFSTPSGQVEVGFKFEGLNRQALSSLSQFLINRYQKQMQEQPPRHLDQERILCVKDIGLKHRLIRFYTMGQQRPLEIYQGSLLLPLKLTVQNIEHDGTRDLILCTIPLNGQHLLHAGEEYTFLFASERAINFFNAPVVQVSSENAIIQMPEEIRQTGFRSSLRLRPSPTDGITVTLRDPKLPDGILEKPLIDLASNGFALPISLEQDLLFPGEHIREIILHLPDGPVHAEGIVRSIHQLSDGQFCFGLEILQYASQLDDERWKQFVFHAAHPRLKLVGPDLVPAVWQVLENSGYLNLISPSLLSHMTNNFFSSWKTFSQRPPTGRLFLFVKGNKPIATASASLLYPGTWMGHHFGIDANERKTDKKVLFNISKEIYAGITHLLHNISSLKYFIFYADTKKGLHELTFERFANLYSASSQLLYDHYKLFKYTFQNNALEVDNSMSHTHHESIEIVKDKGDLLEVLSNHLQNTLKPIKYNAYCLKPDAIQLNKYSSEWPEDYGRERAFFLPFNQKYHLLLSSLKPVKKDLISSIYLTELG